MSIASFSSPARRGAFARTLLAAVLAAGGSLALAADYYLVVPNPAKAKVVELPPADPIVVSLAAGTLPEARVNSAYNTSLTGFLSITGDSAYDGSGVGWSLGALGALPAGLTLGADGTISGTPTVLSPGEGESFEALASYKGESGQQVYTIKVVEYLVEQFSGYRAWSDGTYASSCKTYLQGKSGYRYAGATGNGIYRIQVPGFAPFDVLCDMTTDGGGWTVFQNRHNGSVDFYLTWAEYAAGFGTAATEYWLGNDRVAALTAGGAQLRVDLQRYAGAIGYAQYSTFKVAPASENYRLLIGGFTGSVGDSLIYHNGAMFSTKDRKNDAYTSSCAQQYHGAWWYQQCYYSNLNGTYFGGLSTSYLGMVWNSWVTDSLTRTALKLREN